MATELATIKIPSLTDLVNESEEQYKDNALMVILNQDPPKQWLEQHPTVKVKNAQGQSVPLMFLPISRVEYLLSRIFTKWWVEVKEVKLIANSVVTVVRLYVKNPTNGEVEWTEGVGASPLQIKSKDNGGQGAIDFQNMQSAAVQMAAPSSKSYAIKDAAECFGKLFGKDLGRKDIIDYGSLLKEEPATLEELKDLAVQCMEAGIQLSPQELANYDRITKNQEHKSYNTLRKLLTSKLEQKP